MTVIDLHSVAAGVVVYLTHDARHLAAIPDNSVDVIYTSPPFYGQRSYGTEGDHMGFEIGMETRPQDFLVEMWAVTRELWRILKPTGSLFVNFGDKRAGSGSPGTTKGRIGGASTQGARTGIEGSYPKEWFGRRKGKQMLPHRYVIGCMDGLADPDGVGWIVRQDDVWAKTSSVPEPVEDRTRDAHEYVFHMTKTGAPFCDMAVLRAPHPTIEGALGGPPISWRPVAPRPFKVPADVLAELDAEAHTAAFPVDLILPAIVGYSPSAICTVCGEGRRSLIDRQPGARERDEPIDRIVGQVCACAPLHDGVTSGRKPFTSVYNVDGWEPPPTRPAVVFDPFSGTGTVPGTAAALGRIGIYNDISASYQRVARWRISNTRIIDDSDLPAATAHLTIAADDVLIAGPVANEPSEQLALL